ncbi:MAG TPA: alpha/beta fold hydrolase [Polyangiaceae bacterium]|nr:alpha/beta fold hydrolase [Polyangiaceae bacterium]
MTRFDGEVQLPNGAALRYSAILVADPVLEGSYLGTIDIPMQALTGASLDSVRFLPKEHVDFELALPGEPRWVGHYQADGSLSCQYFQGDVTLPCSMREVTVLKTHVPPPARARQTPLPPFPYQVVDVRIDNSVAHLILAGTLSLPREAGEHGAVLLLGDSDARDRDGTRAAHKPFLVLADHLTRAGIAVLRLDARGVGDSGTSGPHPGAADLESDARAALAFLRARPEIDPRRVGLLGHGFGSVVAARTATHDRAVAFVVLLTPPPEPRAVFSGVRCGVLALGGELDREVDFDRNLPALREALVGAPNVVLETLPGLDHQFQRAAAPPGSSQERSDESFAPEALELISDWIEHTLR